MKNKHEINNLMQAMKVEAKLITFEYTVSLDDGYVIDSNVGKEPMIYHTDTDEMLPALKEELIQMKASESKQVIIPPEKAYGPVKEKAYREFPLDSIPEKARRMGHKVMSRTPDGEEIMVEVIDIKGEKVVLNFNHPLAGQTLHFDVNILSSKNLG
ncbi:MAG: hypothetical protein GY919_00310 [Photobacterium aquimaris]|nr:hypothetical protein [Photobacterium aquimaris]